MSLSQRLDARQSQTLVMTPQLQQAIKLLQFSNQELGDFVAEEIEQNPLLERDESGGEGMSEHVPAEESEAAPRDEESAQSDNEFDDPSWEADDYQSPENYGERGGSFDPADEFSAAQNVAAGQSLREHLVGQIQVDFTDPAERIIAVALVELLDDGGYLPANLDLARAQMGVDVGALESVIKRLQQLDPPGIFARSLEECLEIQLRDKNRLDPAMEKLLRNLDLAAKREHAALMKRCGVDADDLAEMLAEIRALNPKPATSFVSDVAPPITPDVLLRPKHGGGWHVELNSDNLPRVLANERYYTQVRRAARSQPEKEYLSERWQRANWLTKALHQRATTVLKVAAEIVRQQDAFFVNGVQHLKPLVLKEIAAAVEMHESTVSRVTQNKYIATPRGMFELKYFFTTAIATTGGVESVSSTAVRDRIKALVDEENPREVLSDDALAELLRMEGISLARRTVAKYREALRIPTSAQRRREKRTD